MKNLKFQCSLLFLLYAFITYKNNNKKISYKFFSSGKRVAWNNI